jgi:predicted RNase H-like HicB family nuclease
MVSRKQKIQGLVQVPDGYYDVEFEPLDEGGYLARVPALESSTIGKTLDEAREMVADMVEGWLDVARADGLPIPQPKPLIHIAPRVAIAQ